VRYSQPCLAFPGTRFLGVARSMRCRGGGSVSVACIRPNADYVCRRFPDGSSILCQVEYGIRLTCKRAYVRRRVLPVDGRPIGMCESSVGHRGSTSGKGDGRLRGEGAVRRGGAMAV